MTNGTVANNTVYIDGGGGMLLTDTTASDSASANNSVVDNSVSYLLRPKGYYDDRAGGKWYPNPVLASGIHGIRLENADDNYLEGNTVRNDYRGFAVVDGSENNMLVDNGVYALNYSRIDERVYEGNRYLEYAFAMENASGTTVRGLDIGNSTATNTTVSLTGANVSINIHWTPPTNPDAVTVDRYVQVVNRTGASTLDLGIHYEYDDVADIDQATFALWRYDGSEWHSVSDSTLDTDNGTVSAELDDSTLEDSGTYGAFGQNGTWPTPTATPTAGESGDTGTESGDTDTQSATGGTASGTGTAGGSGPGFTAIAALVALVAAALLAGRR